MHHGHGHDHGHRGSATESAHGHGSNRGSVSRASERRRLRWVLAVTLVFTVVEAVAGWISGSLALLADSGHMFSDVSALGLSLIAMRLAERPPSPRRTYGYVRSEILAALVNGAALIAIAVWICWEAWKRFRDPVPIDGPVLLTVAFVGLGVNLLAALLLHRHAGENLNVRGAYLHVIGDLLGSVGAVIAGLVVVAGGPAMVDPLVSLVIALLIVSSAWSLTREAADVLMESAPAHVDVERVIEALGGIDGLHDVHDVHVWTLTSGFVAMSGHGVLDDPTRHNEVLDEIRARLSDHGIGHVTFQLEWPSLVQIRRE